MPKLTLICGLPGSGKSTMARKIAIDTGALHVEADMWVDYSKRYDPDAVKRAHAICQSQARRALQYGGSVVVSNTFTQRWEMQRYIDTAKLLGVDVVVKACEGNWENIHGVPENAISRMRSRWEA
jgi:predicted kinase